MPNYRYRARIDSERDRKNEEDHYEHDSLFILLKWISDRCEKLRSDGACYKVCVETLDK